MVGIGPRNPLTTTATAAVNNAPAGSLPPYLRGLAAVNPNLARDYNADPGLRTFLDANKANLVQWEKPPAGKVADTVNWETWCHTTNIVPAAVRDEEYIVVVGRGSAYANSGNIQFPLQNGGNATSDGRIIYVGKTKDYLATQQVADEKGHYPGAISVDINWPVAGTAGEKVSLSYARLKPDTQGRFHPYHSGWPDTFSGASGGYSGRELTLTLAGGCKQQVDSPDGCSTRSTAKLV